MRRVIGLVLAGVGAFLLVSAVLLPTWVSSQVIKFPLNEYQTASLDASNASYFSASSLTEKTGVNVQATYTIKGDAAAGNSSTAVWDLYSYVYDQTNKQVIQQMTRRMAFDRKTGLLTNCCGANINGDSSVDQRGYVGFVFPIGTQQQTYPVFDVTLRQPMPFLYSGTSTVRGINVYTFTETVAPVKIGTLSVPGSAVGTSAATATLPEYYEMHLIYYVDPVTGALINVDEHQTLSLHDPVTDAAVLLLFDADLKVTPASLDAIVALDNSGRTKVHLIDTILPVIFGIVGVIALIAGIILFRTGRPSMDDELDAMSRDLATSSERPADAGHADSAAAADSGGAADSGAAASAGRHDRAPDDLASLVPGMDSESAETAPLNASLPDGEPPEASGGLGTR